ncbi:MAG: glycosyltransferase, partial [Lachnospiraceae bacterium]|nr:glycosyltransferase [Lachnospiraceae bacterium]
ERSPYNLKNVKAYRALNDFVKKNKFDIIFCHEPMGGVMGRLVGHQNGCKVIYMAHGFHFHKGAPKKNWLIYYTAEKTLALKTDVIITINHEDYRLAKKNFKVKKVYYVPGVGIDLKKFGSHNVDKKAKRKEVGVPVGTTWLLTVGELIPRKNHRVLIDAIKDIPGVFLTIVGDGELTEETQKYIDENQLGQKVKLLGYRTDIDELNEASDVFVFPSLQEGLPVALMEAMACGKPIACSNIRGNSDLINEKGGVLFDPHSVEDCKNAIEKVLCGDKESMGIHNAIAIKKYSLESVEPRLQQIIDTTTAGIPGGY